MTEKKEPKYGVEIPEDELKGYEKRAKRWLKKPDELKEWILMKNLVLMQVMVKMAESPQTQRSGPEKILRAIEEFKSMAIVLVGMMGQRNGDTKIEPERTTTPGPPRREGSPGRFRAGRRSGFKRRKRLASESASMVEKASLDILHSERRGLDADPLDEG